MRLHRLEVEAFGPFASRQVVDFDALGETGLFLITGPTGSGKTSLLDAISFALFGQLPGVRGAKALHSQHADSSTPPEVLLEVTLSGRRLRITRRPAFERPGRKTPVQAAIVLDEHLDGRWTTAAQRLDDAGRILEDALGMTQRQFHRVVVLPQGDFASFLHASTDERGDLLRRLFDVETYAGVQRWLAEERRRVDDADRDATRDLDRLRQDALPHLAALSPDGLDDDATEGDATDDETPAGGTDGDEATGVPASMSQLDAAALADLLARVRSRVESEHLEAVAALEVADATSRRAAAQAQAAHERARSHDRGTRARGAREALLAEADAHDARLHALDRAVAARRALATLPARTRAERERADAEQLVQGRRRRLPDTAPAQDADLADWVAALATQRELVTEAAHRARTLVTLLGRQPDLLAAQRDAEAAVDELGPRRTALRDSLTAAEVELEDSRTAHDELEQLRAETAATERALSVRRAVEDLDSTRVPAAADRARDARDVAQDARQRHQDLLQARLDGMAGELAGSLVDGEPCAVCGSEDHPEPASTAVAVAAEQVETVREVAARAAEALASEQARLAELELERARLLARLGDEDRDAAALESALLALRPRVEQTAARAGRSEVLRRRVDDLTARLDAADADEARRLQQRTAATTRHDEGLRALLSSLDELTESLRTHEQTCRCAGEGGAPPPSPAAQEHPTVLDDDLVAVVEQRVREAASMTERHERSLALGDQMLAAVGAHESAGERFETADRELTDALEAEGFESVDQATALTLPREDVRALDEATRAHAQGLAAATAVLEEPEVREALEQPRPDLAEADAQAERARSAWTAATHRGAELSQSVRILTGLARRGSELATSSGPLAVRRDLVTTVADLAAGRGPQNPDGISLLTYVLAARLERIVAIANERLDTMVTGRYELAVDHGRGDRRSRGGLGLLVHDRWSGETRPATTLSGGETFMVSLALALGTADAVREESGGTELDTLFVDEGFGSLDDDALEEVMAVLDELSAGGRSVGVISHVADMRQRIPTQLAVTRRVDGSSVSLVAQILVA